MNTVGILTTRGIMFRRRASRAFAAGDCFRGGTVRRLLSSDGRGWRVHVRPDRRATVPDGMVLRRGRLQKGAERGR